MRDKKVHVIVGVNMTGCGRESNRVSATVDIEDTTCLSCIRAEIAAKTREIVRMRQALLTAELERIGLTAIYSNAC